MLKKLAKYFVIFQAVMITLSVLVGIVAGVYLGLTDNPVRDQVLEQMEEAGWQVPREQKSVPGEQLD